MDSIEEEINKENINYSNSMEKEVSSGNYIQNNLKNTEII
jgi:hypothetical protein